MKKFFIWGSIVSLSILVSVISSIYVTTVILEREEAVLSKQYKYDYNFDVELNAYLAYDYAQLTKKGDKKLIYKLSCRLLTSNNKHIDPSIYNDDPTKKARLEEFITKSEKLISELKDEGYCER